MLSSSRSAPYEPLSTSPITNDDDEFDSETETRDDISFDDMSSTSSNPKVTVRRLIEKHPSAGFDYGEGKTILDEIDTDDLADMREENIYHPFSSREDFEVGAWFIRSNVSMSDTDKFLKLNAVGL